MATSDTLVRTDNTSTSTGGHETVRAQSQLSGPKLRQPVRPDNEPLNRRRRRSRCLFRSHSLTVADWAGQWKEAFSLFDRDRDGLIGGPELVDVMHRLGMEIQERDVENLLNQWDTDSKGALTLLEFTSLMNSTRCVFASSGTATNSGGAGGYGGAGGRLNQAQRRLQHRLCCYTSEDGGLSTEELLELRAAFDLFDQDCDGALNRHEIRLALELLEESASEEDVDAVMSEADANGNGSVSFKEFCRVLQSADGSAGSANGDGAVQFPGKSTFHHRSAGDEKLEGSGSRL